MHHEIAVLVNLSICLTAALVLGYLTFRLNLSPIVGYLLAGVAVGPQTPGIVADQSSAAQFAEIGVILLMFGVGLHFNFRDLLAVRSVALPGALGQVVVATLLGIAALVLAGWSWSAGAVVGLAISVASTVVLIRVLADNKVLNTQPGHVAVGWLIVEDLFTVLVLVTLPAVASALHAEGQPATAIMGAFGVAVLKIVALGAIVLWGGKKIIPRILEQIARTRQRELFTLSILAIAVAIATGSAYVFGVSMALGAFMAGMVVGQSDVSHQAAADALPMRDAFAVLFFVSVGMLFDPAVIAQHPVLFSVLLAIILVAKPVIAIAVVWLLGHSFRTAMTVAVGLAQIGEFSFILADLGVELKLLEPAGQSLLVACAIVSISINPLLFRGIVPLESWLRRHRRIWSLISSRSEARVRQPLSLPALPDPASEPGRAIVVGYGPVGKTVTTILNDFGLTPVVVDLNVDTVSSVVVAGGLAVYGDASQREILQAAGIATAKYLIITVPDLETRTVIVIVSRELNPTLKVFVRARYFEERAWLEEIGATEICFEEAEAAIGLANMLLHEIGADRERVSRELRRIRRRLALQAGDNPENQAEHPA